MSTQEREKKITIMQGRTRGMGTSEPEETRNHEKPWTGGREKPTL